MTEYCQEHGIIHEVTALYTPQSNDVEHWWTWWTVCYSTQVHPKIFRKKISLMFVSFSMGFSEETLILLPLKVGKGELLTSNSLMSGVTCLRFQYRDRRKGKSTPRLLMLSLSDMHLIAMLTDSKWLTLRSVKYPTPPSLKLEMLFILRTSFLLNLEPLVILLALLLSLIKYFL